MILRFSLGFDDNMVISEKREILFSLIFAFEKHEFET